MIPTDVEPRHEPRPGVLAWPTTIPQVEGISSCRTTDPIPTWSTLQHDDVRTAHAAPDDAQGLVVADKMDHAELGFTMDPDPAGNGTLKLNP